MRLAQGGSLLAAALLAAALPIGVRAEDASTIPGGTRTGPTMQRSMRDNPEMKPYMSMVPAPAEAPAPAATHAAAPPPPPAPPSTREAALRDADGMLQQAVTEMTQHRLRDAEAELEQARMALRNARDGGDLVPEQAISATEKALGDLHHGRTGPAEQAAETAEHAIASVR